MIHLYTTYAGIEIVLYIFNYYFKYNLLIHQQQKSKHGTLLIITFTNAIKGPILTSFPEPMQSQCRPRVREQKFPYVEEASVTVSPMQNAPHAPFAGLDQCWEVGLDWVLIYKTSMVVSLYLIYNLQII